MNILPLPALPNFEIPPSITEFFSSLPETLAVIGQRIQVVAMAALESLTKFIIDFDENPDKINPKMFASICIVSLVALFLTTVLFSEKIMNAVESMTPRRKPRSQHP